MAITQELIDKINEYQSGNETATDILGAIEKSGKYKDVIDKVKFYRNKDQDDDSILEAIKQAKVERSAGDWAKRAYKNAIPSLGKTLMNVPQIVNPETWNKMGKVAAGGIEQGLRKVGWGKKQPESEEERMWKGGIVEPIKRLIDDPVYTAADYYTGNPTGFLMDVAGGAGLVRKGSEVAGMANAAAKAGMVERGLNPIVWGAAIPAKGSNAIRNWTGQKAPRVVRSAMKPWTSMDREITDNMVETALEHRPPLTEGGLRQIQDRKRELNGDISDMVGRWNPSSDPVIESYVKELYGIGEEAGELQNKMKGGQGRPIPLTEPVTPKQVKDIKDAIDGKDKQMRSKGVSETMLVPEMPDSTPLTSNKRGVRTTVGEKGGMTTETRDWTVGDVRSMMKHVNDVIDEAEIQLGRVAITDVNPAKIKELQRKVQEATDRAISSGKVIDNARVAREAEALKEYYGRLPDGDEYVSKIQEWQDRFLSKRGPIMTPQQAQKMKQALYSVNRESYGELSSLRKEFDKALARGLKDQLVEQVPALKGLNAEDSALINLEQYWERALNRIQNYDMIKLGDIVIAVGGQAAAGTGLSGLKAAMAAGIVKHIVDDPGFKMRLAYAMRKAQKKDSILYRGNPVTMEKMYTKPMRGQVIERAGRVGGWEPASPEETGE